MQVQSELRRSFDDHRSSSPKDENVVAKYFKTLTSINTEGQKESDFPPPPQRSTLTTTEKRENANQQQK